MLESAGLDFRRLRYLTLRYEGWDIATSSGVYNNLGCMRVNRGSNNVAQRTIDSVGKCGIVSV